MKYLEKVEQTLNDYTTTVEIGQILKDLSFPVEKKIHTRARSTDCKFVKANQILPQLLNLKENKQDRNTFDIKSELGIVK